MAVPNPDHLFEQAEKLIKPPEGAPRQVDLRRAISAAYYGVFHHVLTTAADEFAGASKRATKRYTLVYRSIDHRALRELYTEAKKQQLSAKSARYAPSETFGPQLQAFASALIDLQEKRHSADYDPSIRLKTSDARLITATARSAIQRFKGASEAQRASFLTLLLFPPR